MIRFKNTLTNPDMCIVLWLSSYRNTGSHIHPAKFVPGNIDSVCRHRQLQYKALHRYKVPNMKVCVPFILQTILLKI